MPEYKCPECGSDELDVTLPCSFFVGKGQLEIDRTDTYPTVADITEAAPMGCLSCLHTGEAAEFMPEENIASAAEDDKARLRDMMPQ